MLRFNSSCTVQDYSGEQEGYGMDETKRGLDEPACCGNAFCDSLSCDDRAILCTHCRICNYKKGDIIEPGVFRNHIALVLDGVLATLKSTNGKLQYIYTPCDIFSHESLFNRDMLEYEDFGIVQAFRPLTVAFLNADDVRFAFMSRPAIARALYSNLSALYNEKCFYRLMVEMDDAYHRVLYMTLYLQQHGIEPPTQEELALMTGLNRVTVGRMLKQIYRNEGYTSLSEYMHQNLQATM